MAVTLHSSVLPNEMIAEALSNLVDARDLGQCLFVSHVWRNLASDDRLWEVVLPRLAPGVPLPSQGQLAYLARHAVTSKEGVALRLQEFTQKARPFLHNSFVCFFPYNEGCTVEAVLDSDAIWPEQGKYKETCIFMRELPSPKSSNSTYRSVGVLEKYFVALPSSGDFSLVTSESLDEISEKGMSIPLSMAQVSSIMKAGARKLTHEVTVALAGVVPIAAAVFGQLQAEDLPD